MAVQGAAPSNTRSQVLPAQVRRDPRTKEDEKEEPGNSIHGKRLDEPVGNPKLTNKPLAGVLGFDALKVDFIIIG